jgi:alpha-amylase
MHGRSSAKCRAASVLILVAGGLGAMPASALAQSEVQANPVMLQWFELSWNRMERRMPDFFTAGYGATWVAPISKPSDPTSPGFDVFDRFDLGSPNVGGVTTNETIYGTEQGFRAVVDAFHRANGLVYVDSVMNHNSGRNGDAGFIAAGGYPQFYMGPAPGGRVTGFGDWGDFWNGAFQSENPSNPNYNLWQGDLVSLIDINHSTNNVFIRHPVEAGNPQNIPAGTIRNRPDPNNRRFYPDTSLPPLVVNNPGVNRNEALFGFSSVDVDSTPGTFTIYPFNTADPMAGDPVPENATGVLMRWSQWMIDEFKIDGFRLDAAKHIQPWFWDKFYDSYMFQRRVAPDGTRVTPFSFGESVEGGSFVYNYYIRKDGFGNRDGLDLSNAGTIREIIGARGTRGANELNNNTIDTFDDGLNNGSAGVRHIHSHDNGTIGNGGSKPDFPYEDKIGYWAYAYMLMRPGNNIVYHNAREMHDRFPVARGGFWPREGVPGALGLGTIYLPQPYTVPSCPSNAGPTTFTPTTVSDDRIPRLVQLSNRYGRGWFVPRVNDGAVYIYTRRTPNLVDNVLVAVNDEYNACVTNFDERTFSTNFVSGQVLVELTGNAASSVVDPGGNIPDTITVGAGGQVTVRVPRNTTRSGTTHTEHNRGYVIYGPATPSGTLSIVGAAQTLPAETTGPLFSRRLTPIDVVQGSTFEINLTTSRAGYPAGDTNFDDTAIFRIGQGFADYNGNGSFDVTTGEFRGYEGFITQRDPIFGTARTNGVYRQTITTSALPEGYNYISVLAFRQRNTGPEAGGLALCNDFRRVIYVDRQQPPMSLVSSEVSCQTQRATIRVSNPDRTVTRVHVFVNQPVGTLDFANQATPLDRQEWTFLTPVLNPGMNTIRVVALEQPSAGVTVNQSVTEFVINNTGVLRGDVDLDGSVTLEDLYAITGLASYSCEADVNVSGTLTNADAEALQDLLRQNELPGVTQFNP